MRLIVVAVGRGRRGGAEALYADYAKRVAQIGPALGFRGVALRELAEARAGDAAVRVAREGEAIFASLETGSVMVALDERGEDLASADLAGWLAELRDRATPSLTFVIGGPDGLARPVVERARRVIAFGRQTWPHLLVRAMLAEQIYRALTIIGRHPYHRA